MRAKDRSNVRQTLPLGDSVVYILRIVHNRSGFPSGLSGPVHRETLLTDCSHNPDILKTRTTDITTSCVTVYNVFFFVTRLL